MKQPQYTAKEVFNFLAGDIFSRGGVDFVANQMQLMIVVISSNPFVLMLESPVVMWLFG